MRSLRRFCLAREGASALEFALILPVFAALMFGSIQMGLAYYYAGTVQYALERTARLAMVDQDMSTGQVQSAFANELSTFTDQNIELSYSIDTTGDVPMAEFSATYQHEFVIPFVPSFTINFPVVTKVPYVPS